MLRDCKGDIYTFNTYPISVTMETYNTFHGAKQVVNGYRFAYDVL
jgi:hypothetical protein